MNPDRIYFSPPAVSAEESAEVISAIESGWVAPAGPYLDLFEKELGKHFDDRPVLALTSGTSALHLAVILCGVTSGDHVIVGTNTFIAAANAVLYQGAHPIFLDSEVDTWNLDPELLERYLRENEGSSNFPKAVIATHIYGRAAKILELASICASFEIALIEDAAEAFGTEVNGRPVGTFGDYGVLSFNGNKIITSGGGGALICNHSGDYNRALSLATQAKAEADHFLHQEIGYNYRLSNILAAIGCAQLRRFKAILEAKKRISDRYAQELMQLEWIEVPGDVEQNCWVFLFLIREEFILKIKPSQILQLFRQENIEARRFWKPLHAQPIFQDSKRMLNGVSDDLFERGICLPSGAGLTDIQQQRVVNVLKQITL
ncbi:MAG: DegT/DnrJ/EryC1/StrS family aminotransferase [Cyclobacteriaceae bacterium]